MKHQRIDQQRATKKLDAVVYDYIVEQIETGTLIEQQRLTEAAIARELGISRTPVRKAFRDLTAAGYLENIANVGVHVKRQPVDVKGFQERSEFLEKLFGYYLFSIESREIQFEPQTLEEVLQKMQPELAEPDTQFEQLSVEYFKAMLVYLANDYMKTAILKSVREIFLCEGQTAQILRASRRKLYEHLLTLTDYLAADDYRMARREMRILLNQMKLDMIEKS